jgi:tetratricopeptide (TPR) repeat protein
MRRNFGYNQIVQDGIKLCNDKKYAEGLECLERAIELDPDNGDAWYSKASCLLDLDRYEEALQAYVKVLSLDPYDEMAKKWAIAIESQWGCKSSKLNAYLTAFECNEFGVACYEAYEPGEENELEMAIAFYSKAIELDPGFAEAFNNRGTAYEKLRRYADALKDYERAVDIKPDYAIAWFNKGQYYLGLAVGGTTGASIKALQCFERVLELDPKDQDAAQAISMLEQQFGYFLQQHKEKLSPESEEPTPQPHELVQELVEHDKLSLWQRFRRWWQKRPA